MATIKTVVDDLSTDGLFVPRRRQDRLVLCNLLSGAGWNQLSDHSPVVSLFR